MKIISCMLFLLCLVIGTLGSFTKVKAQDQNVRKAKELWEKVIAAKGGRKRLFAVRSLLISSTTKYSGPAGGFKEADSKELFVLPDKWWVWGNELGRFVWTYDFGRQIGQEADASATVRVVKPTNSTDSADQSSSIGTYSRFQSTKEKFMEGQLIYLMETKWLQPMVVKAWTDRLGFKKVDVIETSFGRQRFEFYIDRKTHLPMQVIIRTRIERTGRDVVDRYMLGDYVEVAGIKFPRIVKEGGKNETTYQVNVDYVNSIFERPPTIDMGPDAWKRSR